MRETLADMRTDSVIIRQWKDEMKNLIRNRFGDLNDKKIEKYLDKKIMTYGKNPKVVLVNNYRNREIKTNLLELIDYIEEYGIIIGGEGCLFMPHPENEEDCHVIIKFILWVQKDRKVWKKIRSKKDKGTLEWIAADLAQNNRKLKINGLYGCLGCQSFILFNRFLAASITNVGRQIICTATMVFENFLGVDVKYNMESEVFTFIERVRNHIREDFPLGIDTSPYQIDHIKSAVSMKLQERCAFTLTVDFIRQLEGILDSCTIDELTILYYKNNLLEFCKTESIRGRLHYIMTHIDQLRTPEIDSVVESGNMSLEIKQKIDEVEELFDTYVVYTDPMFDRVRRTMFTDRDKVLYTDTDSTFLALNEWVTFIKEDVLQNHYAIEETEMNFVAVNVMTYILGFVIAKGLKSMCDCMNIEETWSKLLVMKNEFYLSMIVFTNAKKRYISDAVLQEGVLLRDKKTGEIGYPEIKGFDFKKAVVKPYVTEFYTNLSIYGILRTKQIRVDQVYSQVLQLKTDIEKAIRSGSREYYKQAKVQLIEQYKKPYAVQGIRAVLLWNCLFEDMQMELPIDVDIVTIKVISDKKGRLWLESKYPDIYAKVDKEFFQNSNELIRNMELKVIALPKNDFQIPDWLHDLIDEEKIVSDIMSLFYPIMESLGLYTNKVGKKTYLTNMVDL